MHSINTTWFDLFFDYLDNQLFHLADNWPNKLREMYVISQDYPQGEKGLRARLQNVVDRYKVIDIYPYCLYMSSFQL